MDTTQQIDTLSYFHSCEWGVFDVFCALVSWSWWTWCLYCCFSGNIAHKIVAQQTVVEIHPPAVKGVPPIKDGSFIILLAHSAGSLNYQSSMLDENCSVYRVQSRSGSTIKATGLITCCDWTDFYSILADSSPYIHSGRPVPPRSDSPLDSHQVLPRPCYIKSTIVPNDVWYSVPPDIDLWTPSDRAPAWLQ